ncbi:hypothetical protein D3C72_1133300 [compost metagenome]
MAIAHLQQGWQRLIRLKREKFHIVQAAFADHFLKPGFATALPDNHKHPRVIVKLLRGVDNTFQPLFFPDVAGVKNDFLIRRQTELGT